MRKMMSSMKKGTAVAMAAVMCISLAGCGGSTKKVVADKKETIATTTAAETQTETAQETEAVNDSDMAEILAGTTWAGISSEQEIMVAAFDEKDVYMAILDTNGEVTDLDGYQYIVFEITIPLTCLRI